MSTWVPMGFRWTNCHVQKTKKTSETIISEFNVFFVFPRNWAKRSNLTTTFSAGLKPSISERYAIPIQKRTVSRLKLTFTDFHMIFFIYIYLFKFTQKISPNTTATGPGILHSAPKKRRRVQRVRQEAAIPKPWPSDEVDAKLADVKVGEPQLRNAKKGAQNGCFGMNRGMKSYPVI